MQSKEPVMLNDSLVEVEGEPLDFDWMKFWSDTFRQTDVLQYQDDDVKMMFDNDETTTFELTVKTEDLPESLDYLWKTGERFHINVENEYFDLNVDSAWIADKSDGVVTIVAKVLRRGLAYA